MQTLIHFALEQMEGAAFSLSHTFFFVHRQATLAQQATDNPLLSPKVNCMHCGFTSQSFCRGAK